MRLPALCLVLASLIGSATAAPRYSATVSSEWVENMSRSSSGIDWQDGLRLRARGLGAVTRSLDGNFQATGEAEFQAEATPKFENLRVFELTARGELRRKFGLGPMAPVLALNGSLSGRESAIDGEDGLRTRLALSATKRVTETWRASANIDWVRDHARSAVFDTSYRKFGAELAWDITPSWQLSGGAGRLDGTFIANASGFVWNRALTGLLGSAIQQYYTVAPQAVTDSYAPGWVTYLVSGRVRNWWVALTPALSDDTSLALQFENSLATNIVNVRYRTTLWSLALNHRF